MLYLPGLNKSSGRLFKLLQGLCLVAGVKVFYTPRLPKVPAKEQEAHDFFKKWTFTKEQEAEIMDAAPLSREDIVSFAEKFKTHPAMICQKHKDHSMMKTQNKMIRINVINKPVG